MNINNDPVWIEVNVTGEYPPVQWFGKFQVKPYLTLSERRDASVLSSTYLRGITEDLRMRQMLAAVAQLKFHIIKADAEWWTNDGMDLLDDTPVTEMIRLVNELQMPKKPEESK